MSLPLIISPEAEEDLAEAKAWYDLDVSQWEFFVISAATLNKFLPSRKQLGLGALQKLNPVQCKFGGLRVAIERVAAEIRIKSPTE